MAALLFICMSFEYACADNDSSALEVSYTVLGIKVQGAEHGSYGSTGTEYGNEEHDFIVSEGETESFIVKPEDGYSIDYDNCSFGNNVSVEKNSDGTATITVKDIKSIENVKLAFKKNDPVKHQVTVTSSGNGKTYVSINGGELVLVNGQITFEADSSTVILVKTVAPSGYYTYAVVNGVAAEIASDGSFTVKNLSNETLIKVVYTAKIGPAFTGDSFNPMVCLLLMALSAAALAVITKKKRIL